MKKDANQTALFLSTKELTFMHLHSIHEQGEASEIFANEERRRGGEREGQKANASRGLHFFHLNVPTANMKAYTRLGFSKAIITKIAIFLKFTVL